MEDVIKQHNRGVLPANMLESNSGGNETPQLTETRTTEVETEAQAEPSPEKNADTSVYDETTQYRRDYSHVRSPELKRGEHVILMSATAVCGAVAGTILALSGQADTSALSKIIRDLSIGFRDIFFQRLLIGAVFLLAEFILGFFAFGDLFVWAAPLCYAMGLSLRIAATENWILLPSAIVTLIACIMGAATSSDLSRTLIRLSRGGTVYLEDSLQKKYLVSFLGYLAAVIAGAIYEGAVLN